MVTDQIWPALDYSRVPYRLYHDAEIYEREQRQIFQGPVWNYLGLEAEIPEPGDFRSTWVGETPVVFNRDRTGMVKAFVNRCAHRGALVRRELSGNAREHICIYHQWCYGLDGGLTAIPFRRGVRGKGGLDADFDMGAHGLRPLRVGIVDGVIFGTLAQDAEPIADYLGAPILVQLRRLFDRPVHVLGYNRQRIRAIGSSMPRIPATTIMPACCTNFWSPSGSTVRPRWAASRWTCATVTTSPGQRPTATPTRSPVRRMASVGVRNDYLSLKEPALVTFRPEREDKLNLAVTSVFPSSVFVQISNSLAIRQIRPRGVDEFEVFQTMIGYADDFPEMTLHRLRQANLVGPAGLVSMEDGEAIEIVHRASKPDPDRTTIIELGGGGVISDRDYRVTDVPLRGFWSYYAELLGIEPAGAVR